MQHIRNLLGPFSRYSTGFQTPKTQAENPDQYDSVKKMPAETSATIPLPPQPGEGLQSSNAEKLLQQYRDAASQAMREGTDAILNYSHTIKGSFGGQVTFRWDATHGQMVAEKTVSGWFAKMLKDREISTMKAAHAGGVNTPKIFSSEVKDDSYKVVMSIASQGSLVSSNKRDSFDILKQLPLSERANLVIQLLSNISILHQLGINHGDIQLANLFRDRGRLVIGDFGSAMQKDDFSEDVLDVARTLTKMLTASCDPLILDPYSPTKKLDQIQLKTILDTLNISGLNTTEMAADICMMLHENKALRPSIKQILEKPWITVLSRLAS